MLEKIRHYARYAVNVLTLVIAVTNLPQWQPFGLAQIAVINAIANTVLSWLRPFTER